MLPDEEVVGFSVVLGTVATGTATLPELLSKLREQKVEKVA